MIPTKESLIPYINNRKEAAKFFNVTEKTIINWMKKYEIYNPKKNYGCNKLNAEKAIEIRKLYENGCKIKEISKKYSVTFATISRIINNKIYKEGNDLALINVIYNTSDVSESSLSGLVAVNTPFDEQK